MTTRTDTPPTSPEQLIELFSEHINAGDVDAMAALYEPDAAFVPEPGGPVLQGLRAIREALAGFAALEPTLSGEIEKVLEADGIALVANRWTLTGTGPDGSTVDIGGVSADVLRRQPDGTWRVLIDNPWGERA